MIAEKERELNATASNVIDKDQLVEAIAQVQTGADNYKLRSEIASQLQSLVSSLYVGTIGNALLRKKARDFDGVMLTRSTAIHRVCYAEAKQYMVLWFKRRDGGDGAPYHFCALGPDVFKEFYGGGLDGALLQ